MRKNNAKHDKWWPQLYLWIINTDQSFSLCVFVTQFFKYPFKRVKRGLGFVLVCFLKWRVGREAASPSVFQKYERCLLTETCYLTFRSHEWGGGPLRRGGAGWEGKVITLVAQNITSVFSMNQVLKKGNLILVSLLVLQLAITVGIRIT